jgi:threonine dehydrogenase-like Zn-dependent dehydrogenase
MKAMTFRGSYRVRVDEKPDPKIEHPQDAIIRVTRAAICGSDLHLYHGLVPDCRIGTTFGHEFTGIVERVGSGVEHLKVGDHVLIPFNISCGSCFFCDHNLLSNCHNTNPNATAVGGIYGYSHTTGGYDGGQAEFVRVPMADVNHVKIPAGVHEEDALLCTDVFPTGYQAAEMADIKKGDNVVIFGAGPIGLLAAKSAWLMGAGRVLVVDKLQYRLDFAKQWTGCEIMNFAEVEDVVLELKKQFDWVGPDACIDCVGAEATGKMTDHLTGVILPIQAGAPTAVAWAINSVRKGGVVSVVGVYGPTVNMIPLGNLVNKGITMRGNQAIVMRHLPRLLEHIKEGRVHPREIITHRIPLEEIAEGYHMFSSKLDNIIKPVVVPAYAGH